jgi:hypothetical protein
VLENCLRDELVVKILFGQAAQQVDFNHIKCIRGLLRLKMLTMVQSDCYGISKYQIFLSHFYKHFQVIFHMHNVFVFSIPVSGLSGSKEVAQSQVLIGMGLLAGSTVMLLTILWGSCVVVGKCDLSENSTTLDSQDTKAFSLFGMSDIHCVISQILVWGPT